MDARRGLGRAIALACAVFALLAPAALAYPPVLQWGEQAPVDTIRPPWVTYRISAGACPSPQRCVVADERGNVYVSDDPTGGRDTWAIAEADSRNRIEDMACPSTSLCVAVDDAGNVVTSHDPAAGTWSVKHISERPLRNVECPATTFCIASDDEGNVYTSPDAANWTKTKSGHVIAALACPTASLCVAVSYGSTLMTSTNPAGGAAAWDDVFLHDMTTAVYVTCASPALCVVSGDGGRYAVSTNPAGAWTELSFGEANFFPILCPTTSFCIAGEPNGRLFTTSDPSGGAAAWTKTKVADDYVAPVACAGAGLCVTATQDALGEVLASETPASGPWTAAGFAGMGTNALLAADCPSATRCFATDDAGRVLESGDPTGDRHAWTPLDIGASALGAISCPTTTLCIAGDDDGNVYRSSDGWHGAQIAGGAAITGIDCPTASYCVAVDDAGAVHTSTGGAWTSAAVDAGHALNAVSCASETLCVTGDDAGRTFTSTEPAGAWRQGENSLAGSLVDVSCPSDALCAAVDDDGHVAFNTDPAYAHSHWLWETPGVNTFTSVDCPSDSLCLATTAEGLEYSSTDPADKHSTWDREKSYGTPLTAVACAGGDLCVALDSLGELSAGVSLGFPYNAGRPQVTGTALPGQVLTCSPGTWTGSPSFTYQWRRADNEIAGAAGPLYTVGAADLGWPLSCTVTASNGFGRAVASSSPRAPVVPALLVTRAPQIVGTAIVGEAVRCDGAAFQGAGAVNITAYAWHRDGARIDWPSQYSHYILNSDDSGHELKCSATATNDTTSLTATSAPVRVNGRVVIAGRPPLNARVKAKAVRRDELLRHGLPVTVTCSQRCVVTLQVRQAGRVTGQLTVTVTKAGAKTVRVRLSKTAKRRLAKSRKFTLALSATERTAGRLPGATVTVRR